MSINVGPSIILHLYPVLVMLANWIKPKWKPGDLKGFKNMWRENYATHKDYSVLSK